MLNKLNTKVMLCKVLHEKEKRPKGGNTRLQFFFIVFISSFPGAKLSFSFNIKLFPSYVMLGIDIVKMQVVIITMVIIVVIITSFKLTVDG